jgi:hypothetical protein
MFNQLYLLNFQVIKFISTNISTKKLANQYKEQFASQQRRDGYFSINSSKRFWNPLKIGQTK